MRLWVLTSAFLLLATTSPRAEGESAEELAKQLVNPVASLISVPFQFNYDHNIGPEDEGHRVTTNFQPVVPIAISDDWNVISRTIAPITWQNEIFPGAGSQFGLGDVAASFFFSPNARGPGGLIWGVGPELYLPTATDDLLGGGKWAAGPTAVALLQEGHWTVGILANHLWSFAGDEARPDIDQTYAQPFVAYTTKDAWTFSLNTETTYNWEVEQDHWSVPINAQVSKLTHIGGQAVSFGAAARYWTVSPDSGPEGFGLRFVVAFLFPE